MRVIGRYLCVFADDQSAFRVQNLICACLSVQAYLLPYRVEEYAETVRPLKLWPNPRGHFRGLTRVPLQVYTSPAGGFPPCTSLALRQALAFRLRCTWMPACMHACTLFFLILGAGGWGGERA